MGMKKLNMISALLMMGGIFEPELMKYEDNTPKKNQIPFEVLEAEYNLIREKKSKLSRAQRDKVCRLYKNRKQL